MAVMGYARVGKARLNAFRIGYFSPRMVVYVNSVDQTLQTRITGASITDELNHVPNTVQLRCDGFTPVQGQQVQISMGSADLQLFAGHILSVSQTYEGKPANIAWDVDCIDYTWLLNRHKVIKKYTNQSATAIILDLIATFATNFTTVHVVSGLPVIDEITFTNEDLTDAITRVMTRIGGYWFVDFNKDINAFLTNTETAGAITQASPRGMSNIQQHTDLSQIATRVWARGGGSNAASDVSVGATTLPVEDGSWYDVAGGTVECGPQRITYTGIGSGGATGTTTGNVPAPPATFTITGPAGAGSLDPSAVYGYAFTYVTAAGETTPSATVSGTSGASGQAQVNGAPVPTDPAITGRHLYRTEGGLSVLKKLTTGGPYAPTTPTIITDTIPDSSLGAVPPTSNTAGASAESVAAGATSLPVDDCAVFLAAGGWAMAPGDQLFSYTARSATSGPGSLTGIPATGVGSLSAAVKSGTIKAVPHLTGVTGIVYAINKGDAVNLVAGVGDATAQTAMSTWIGYGDGVHEQFISDGRWGLTEATAQANAELTRRKNPLVTVSFQSRDPTLMSGRDITITLTTPAISGTFKIQRVTYSDLGIGGASHPVFPLRHVECSSQRFSFEDLVRQIKSRAA